VESVLIKLYQFPISHYCEKIRWALDFKSLDYQKVNVIPGLHMKPMKRLSGQYSVPVLQDGKVVVANSDKILDYLDLKYPENPLTPDDENLKAQVYEWEKFADQQVGIHVRRVCYHTLLDHPKLVRRFFSQDGPWYGSLFIRLAFPKLSVKMRHLMKINSAAVEESKTIIEKSLSTLVEHLGERKFLVGDQFTRADLSVAALLAPFCRPEKYGLHWPESFPRELEDYLQGFRGQLAWVDHMYQNYR
jgi:glutathione S-transferase